MQLPIVQALRSWQAWPVLSSGRVTLLLLAAVAALSRFWALGRKSLWLDEAFSANLTDRSFQRIIDYTYHVDKHPPLYYFLLKLWTGAVGDSEYALRALSALAGVGVVVLVAALALRLAGPRFAALAGLLLILNASNVFHSQETRMYALAALLTVAATALLAGLLDRPTVWKMVGYVIVAGALLYTHYGGIMVLALHATLVGVYLLRRQGEGLAAAGALAVLALLYLPWLPALQNNVSTGVPHGQPTGPLGSQAAWRSIVGLSGAGDYWLFLVLPVVPLAAWAVAKRRNDPLVLGMALLALGPLAYALASTFVTPIYSARQISLFAPALSFLLALGLWEGLGLARSLLSKRPQFLMAFLSFALTAGVLVAGVIGLRDIYGAPSSEDWRSAARDLSGYQEPIYISKSFMAIPFVYYWGTGRNVFRATENTISLQDFRPGDGFTVDLYPYWERNSRPMDFRPGDRFTVIVSHNDPRLALKQLQQRTCTVDEKHYNGIHVYRLLVSPPVDVLCTYQAADRWFVTPEGYLQSQHAISYFRLTEMVDADQDARVDADFTIRIEYLDEGPNAFTVSGLDSRDKWNEVQLAEARMEGTGEWRELDVRIRAGDYISNRFFVSSDVTIRTISSDVATSTLNGP